MPQTEVEAIAKQVFEYGGRLRTPGERFKVEARFFALLVALGRIEAVPADTPRAPGNDGDAQTYRTRAMTAEPPAKARRNRASIIGSSRAAGRPAS